MPVNFNNFGYCPPTGGCTPVVLPNLGSNNCNCVTWNGRLNDLVWISCSEQVDEAALTDLANWTTWITDGKVRTQGKGIGGIKVKGNTNTDLGGCIGEEVTDTDWELTFKQYCIDKTATYATHEFANALRSGANKSYNLFGRLCDDTDVLIPIGTVNVLKADFVLPEGNKEKAYFEYEFNWKSIKNPLPLNITGLTTVLPAAK